MEERTEASVIGRYAQEAIEPVVLKPGQVYNVGGEVVDTSAWADRPSRMKVHRVLSGVDSLLDYVTRHADDTSEIWADAVHGRFVLVIDGARPHESAGWEEHRAVLELRHSPQWLAWMALDRVMMPQAEFAEHVEANLIDIAEPDSAHMLEVAQSLEATTKAEFQSSVRLVSGQVRFHYAETTTARAGTTGGDVEVPHRFKLAIRPYLDGGLYAVWARLRYRAGKDGLLLGYVLERPSDILEAAFEDMVSKIAASTATPLYRGRP